MEKLIDYIAELGLIAHIPFLKLCTNHVHSDFISFVSHKLSHFKTYSSHLSYKPQIIIYISNKPKF